MRHWIGVAARAHVRAGVAGGFAQLGHGRHGEVTALCKGDWIAYYSPKERLDGAETVRAFTALGQVVSDAPYQATQAEGFMPWRVDVAYRTDAREASIRPLLDRLELTRARGTHWGIAFRRSRIAVTASDFALIAQAMGLPDPA